MFSLKRERERGGAAGGGATAKFGRVRSGEREEAGQVFIYSNQQGERADELFVSDLCSSWN